MVGSLNVDLVSGVDRLPRAGETILARSATAGAGGKGLNQAVAARRYGATVGMVGCVGDDADGRFLLSVLEGEGIDHAFVTTPDATPTGRAFITLDPSGEGHIVVAAGANGLLTAEAAAEAVRLAGPRVVIAQLESPVDAVHAAFAAAKEIGATTVLNPAPPSAQALATLAPVVDIAVPNEHEAAVWTHGLEWSGDLVVTLGRAGSRWTAPDGLVTEVASHEVRAVDTTAAGDAFCGVLAAALAGGRDLQEALHAASAAGALAVTRQGAVDALAGRDEIDALLEAAAR